MLLNSVLLPGKGSKDTFDVEIEDATNEIISIKTSSRATSKECPARVVPTLCHPHIHLDKPFLLTCHNSGDDLPNYLDLAPEDGSFSEALARTSEAKKRYTHNDLVLRGSQLIAESIQAGVTSMRAFVEVDHVTQHKCVQAGVELKQRFTERCYVQLCAFAQDPVFNADKHGDENRRLMEEVLQQYQGQIEVLGSTPYVEGSKELQEKNIDWAIKTAIEHKLHLDFHLDYNLDQESPAMIWYVVKRLISMDWKTKAKGKTVVIGHCTRMTLFKEDEMKTIAQKITEAKLPISFVGLPTSDLFMMGRPSEGSWTAQRPRGTLPVLDLIRKFNLNACIGINNVGNAFTPWGNVDPLRLASLCVGVYQAGTPKDAEVLFECISALAQTAIGLDHLVVRSLEEGTNALFMVISNNKTIDVAGIEIPARQRSSVADMVWDPAELRQRRVIGRLPKI